MKEKKLAGRNISNGQIIGYSWSPKPKGLGIGRSTRNPNSTGANKNPLKETLTEPDFMQSRSTPLKEQVDLECPREVQSPSGEKLAGMVYIQLGLEYPDESSETTNLLM